MPRRESVPEPAPQTPERHETWEWSVRSLASETHPNRNEDAVLVDSEHGLAGVFDGMGGHAYGDEASRAAAAAIQRALIAWEQVTDEDDSSIQRESLANLLRGAHRRVLDIGDELYRERYQKLPENEKKAYRAPQTTAVVAMVHRFSDGHSVLAVAHAGDSRAWRVGADGSLEQLTADHDYLSNADRRHALEELYGIELTETVVAQYRAQLDEAKDETQMNDPLGKFLFRTRNVIATALGMRGDVFHVDTKTCPVRPGDIVLLTSDGVHDNLTTSRMREISASAHGPDELVDLLTREAAASAANAPRTIHEGDVLSRMHRDDMTAVALLIT